MFVFKNIHKNTNRVLVIQTEFPLTGCSNEVLCGLINQKNYPQLFRDSDLHLATNMILSLLGEQMTAVLYRNSAGQQTGFYVTNFLHLEIHSWIYCDQFFDERLDLTVGNDQTKKEEAGRSSSGGASGGA